MLIDRTLIPVSYTHLDVYKRQIHEGVAAQALERRGIISDRCELNRQIKADNALLRELKSAVQKLTQTVKNTLPAIAEAMENLRKNLLLFCYQLGYLRKGKERLNASLNTLRPALTPVSYTHLYDGFL